MGYWIVGGCLGVGVIWKEGLRFEGVFPRDFPKDVIAAVLGF